MKQIDKLIINSPYLEGKLPQGAHNKVEVQVASLVAALTMKGIVLGVRYRKK